MLLSLVLLLSLIRGLTPLAEEFISPVGYEVNGTEEQNVSLRCNYGTDSGFPNLHWYKQVSDVEAPQFLLWKGAKKESEKSFIPNDRYRSVTTDSSTELQIETAALSDSGLYYCALDGLGYALIFGKPIRLTVSPEDVSPVSPVLFLLGRLHPAGSSLVQSGPDVCLAAGFRPSGADLVLEAALNRVTVKTGPARLSAATRTFYYPGFSNDTIRSCQMGETSSGEKLKADKTPDKIYPDEAKQNFFLLLVSGVRLILAKVVTFNTVLTIRALIM